MHKTFNNCLIFTDFKMLLKIICYGLYPENCPTQLIIIVEVKEKPSVLESSFAGLVTEV